MATSPMQILEAKTNFQLYLYLSIWNGLFLVKICRYRRTFIVNCPINTAQTNSAFTPKPI